MFTTKTLGAEDASDGRDIANEIVIEVVVERRIDRFWSTDQKERVSIRQRATSERTGLAAPYTFLCRRTSQCAALKVHSCHPLARVQGLNDKCQRCRQSQADDEHQPVTEIKSQKPTFSDHAPVLRRLSAVPGDLARLSPSGCSVADTVHGNYLITPRHTM